LAVTDAFATASEYRSAVDQDDQTEDSELLLFLTATSRYIERWMPRMRSGTPRHFTSDAAVTTRLFDGNGKTRLWVDDISTTTGLIVKADLNGDYDVLDSGETLTIDADFWVGPANATAGGEVKPYTYLDICPNSTVLTAWPKWQRSVSVTARFGWPAVPEAVKRATIGLTKALRDISKAPYSLAYENIENAVRMSPVANNLLDEIIYSYGDSVVNV
jgi:hypothetical protein